MYLQQALIIQCLANKALGGPLLHLYGPTSHSTTRCPWIRGREAFDLDDGAHRSPHSSLSLEIVVC